MMNEFKYVKGTLSKLRKRDIAGVLLKSVLLYPKMYVNNVRMSLLVRLMTVATNAK